MALIPVAIKTVLLLCAMVLSAESLHSRTGRKFARSTEAANGAGKYLFLVWIGTFSALAVAWAAVAYRIWSLLALAVFLQGAAAAWTWSLRWPRFALGGTVTSTDSEMKPGGANLLRLTFSSILYFAELPTSALVIAMLFSIF